MASPEFVNFNSFDFRPALRMTFNISQGVAVGFEPGDAMLAKTYSVNTNIHIAF